MPFTFIKLHSAYPSAGTVSCSTCPSGVLNEEEELSMVTTKSLSVVEFTKNTCFWSIIVPALYRVSSVMDTVSVMHLTKLLSNAVVGIVYPVFKLTVKVPDVVIGELATVKYVDGILKPTLVTPVLNVGLFLI